MIRIRIPDQNRITKTKHSLSMGLDRNYGGWMQGMCSTRIRLPLPVTNGLDLERDIEPFQRQLDSIPDL